LNVRDGPRRYLGQSMSTLSQILSKIENQSTVGNLRSNTISKISRGTQSRFLEEGFCIECEIWYSDTGTVKSSALQPLKNANDA